jgi:hypothetical protein
MITLSPKMFSKDYGLWKKEEAVHALEHEKREKE